MSFVSRVVKSTAVALTGMAIAMGGAQAQQVKFMMDWAWQGPQAFALVAMKKGYFAEEGVTVQVDRGFGSGRVPVELAAGTYQMGFADINPTIKLMAEKPETGLLVVAVLNDASPLVAIVKADSAIKTPKDLEGKKLAAPEFDSGRQLFPAFAKKAGIDASKVEFLSVKPELREPMLVQGQADGITGFVTSGVQSLEKIGLPRSQQRIFYYKDFGADFYGSSIITTKKFAEENPKAVAGVVRALIRGFNYAIKNPDEAMAMLKEHEQLTDVPLEKDRWIMSIEQLIATPNVKANGLSSVSMPRLQETIQLVEDAYKIPNKLKAEDIYTTKFLPPAADLKVN
jgi:NitT/TauT family transport system substrate-binding protein